MLADPARDRLRARAGADLLRRARERRPVAGMTARDQRDRRRAHRRHGALAAVRAALARLEARPGDPPGEALVVEPARLVAGDARRQDLGLPGAGRRLEAFELGDDHLDRVGPLHARVRRDPLPADEEAQEVARGDRLDLGAQTLDGVVVDPGEQPALAPFLGRCRRREAPAQREAFGLERRERGRDLLRPEPERRRERALGHRPQPLEPAAQDLDQGVLRRPVPPLVGGRGGDRGLEPRCGPERPELRQRARRRSRASPRRSKGAPRAARPRAL